MNNSWWANYSTKTRSNNKFKCRSMLSNKQLRKTLIRLFHKVTSLIQMSSWLSTIFQSLLSFVVLKVTTRLQLPITKRWQHSIQRMDPAGLLLDTAIFSQITSTKLLMHINMRCIVLKILKILSSGMALAFYMRNLNHMTMLSQRLLLFLKCLQTFIKNLMYFTS